ncbi:MAG: asparagine synthase [Pirellulaceae bacterium]|nr:MAG: asparagine synthase [Pirellulaceae bacterium]
MQRDGSQQLLDSEGGSSAVTASAEMASAVRYTSVARFVDLMDPDADVLLNTTRAAAVAAVASGDIQRIRSLDGHFAIAVRSDRIVRMARSLGRPMRYFLAKEADGPCLVVAERIDQIRRWLEQHGLQDQFHPSYTRMVPAHYLVELQLVGCPDPNPRYQRFFTPQSERLPADLDGIGRAYIGTLADEVARWLKTVEPREPIGVLFSGGIDSGSVLLVLYHVMLTSGISASRLKAFTLSVDDAGPDIEQAYEFVRAVGLDYLWEVIRVPVEEVRVEDAVRAIEDYKPLDVQAAAMTLALCRGIRHRYPQWKYLVDGDGGDENLKDYPIEDNPELTIRSVLNNRLLYQEGWGIDAIKHSLVYSGGQSRGHVRSYAPPRLLGFRSFSPYALPNVIDVAERIPFVELTEWDPQRLYALKGEIVRRGVEAITGMKMPVFPKRRFQHGAASHATAQRLFPREERAYRRLFEQLFA